jgi:hypothetical protein
MIFKKLTKWFRRPSNPSGYVYYARLKTPQGIFYKLGYTSKPTLKDRFAYGGNGDEKLIDRQFIFTFRQNAWDIEQMLLEHFDKHRIFGKFSNDFAMPLAGRGQSELFKRDILGLDDDLYAECEFEKSGVSQTSLNEGGFGCFITLLGIVLAPFTLGFSLFLVAGGLSSIFGSSSDQQQETKHDGIYKPNRPVHTPKIKAVIDSLCSSNL